jgi:site-specific recombinase XerD
MSPAWQLTRDMFLSPSEIDALLEYVGKQCQANADRALASAQLDRAIIEGLLFSGLRTSEFCRLTLADTVIGRKQSVFVVTGLKGRDRVVYVPSAVSDLLKTYVRETRPVFLPAGVDPRDRSQPLIFSEHKNPLERTGLYRRVVRILSGAGLGARASVQLLRHTYGYLAYLRSGGNLLFVQRQLGHAHPMVTSIYAQFVDENYESLADDVYVGTCDTKPARRRSNRA